MDQDKLKKLETQLRDAKLELAYRRMGGDPRSYWEFKGFVAPLQYDSDRDTFTHQGRAIDLDQHVAELRSKSPALQAVFGEQSQTNSNSDSPVFQLSQFNDVIKNPRKMGLDCESRDVPRLVKDGKIRFLPVEPDGA